MIRERAYDKYHRRVFPLAMFGAVAWLGVVPFVVGADQMTWLSLAAAFGPPFTMFAIATYAAVQMRRHRPPPQGTFPEQVRLAQSHGWYIERSYPVKRSPQAARLVYVLKHAAPNDDGPVLLIEVDLHGRRCGHATLALQDHQIRILHHDDDLTAVIVHQPTTTADCPVGQPLQPPS